MRRYAAYFFIWYLTQTLPAALTLTNFTLKDDREVQTTWLNKAILEGTPCNTIEAALNKIPRSKSLAQITTKNIYGESPLHIAAKMNRPDLIQLFIEEFEADIEARDSMGKTPLMTACLSKNDHKPNIEVINMLINQGANIHVCTEKSLSISPLMEKYGIDYCAQLEIRKKLETADEFKTVDENGHPYDGLVTWVHISSVNSPRTILKDGFKTGLREAIMFGSYKAVEQIINETKNRSWPIGELINHREQIAQWTPLHFAAKFGYINIARLLINEKADPNAQADDGNTPLHVALANGRWAFARILHQELEALQLPMLENKQGLTPLRFAGSSPYFKKLQLASFIKDEKEIINIHYRNISACSATTCTSTITSASWASIPNLIILDNDNLDSKNSTPTNLPSCSLSNNAAKYFPASPAKRDVIAIPNKPWWCCG